jgi:hypothetical protein
VVFGVWLIFGSLGLTSLVLLVMARDMGIGFTAFSAFMLVISIVVIWKSTRNYLARPKAGEHYDD